MISMAIVTGALELGFIYALVALALFLSFRILNIADMTTDGAFTLGCAVSATVALAGHPFLALPAAMAAGACAGVITALLQTKWGVPSILAGIITNTGLYTVNLAVMGFSSNVNMLKATTIFSAFPGMKLIPAMVITLFMVALLVVFLNTRLGLSIRATGDNPDMSRAQGVDVNRNKVIGLAIANGIVAMAGALLAQYKGSANINDGRGAIVIGLAAIFIGLSISLKIKPNFVVSLIGVIGGGIIYYIVYNVVILLGLKTDYLKMLSALIVALFLGIPYLKATYFTKYKDLHPSQITTPGGDGNA